MVNNKLRLAILALILSNATNAFSDQKIKTKSNIKNDRMEQPESPNVKCPEENATDFAATSTTNKTATNTKVDCTVKKPSENVSPTESNSKK